MTFFSRLRKTGNPYHDAQGLFTSADSNGSMGERGMRLSQVSGQKGSNPGGLYKDVQGTHYYVKFYSNPHQGKTEELASQLFEMYEMIVSAIPDPEQRAAATEALAHRDSPGLGAAMNEWTPSPKPMTAAEKAHYANLIDLVEDPKTRESLYEELRHGNREVIETILREEGGK